MISHDATTQRRLEPGGHRPRYPSPNLITWQSSEKDVEDLFIKFGKVTEARVATDRETGSSRGFGFVTFEDPRDADDAIRQLDNSEFMGRTIFVQVSKPKAPGGGGGGYGGGGYGG
eukprot:CAMPEP_0182601480 /NCGR_PEP_ID=MMETSP1324-20130603/91486_1 /TAXON_ID=236786 /ORGANISM="Florenciella sp., Strain RCC1587" /LENGTH=115 /DNA_ID=CAMNT_0024819391 /DNA_START=908 /DNA_END=1251 /DNA_ORIENTATION=-